MSYQTMNHQFIEIEQHDQIATVWINRAELHNAFNTQVIAELHATFDALNVGDDIRVVILAGRGKSFSAGADLNWMKVQSEASASDNQADALKLAKIDKFQAIGLIDPYGVSGEIEGQEDNSFGIDLLISNLEFS